MFMQEFHGKVRDRDLWERQMEVWRTQIQPNATGFLGSTSGVTADGTVVAVACFEDEAKARANSSLPAQSTWFEETAKAFDGPIEFHDCADCHTYGEGAATSAGFVQVMEGHARDVDAMREMESAMEDELGRMRPDLLGTLTGWEPDGSFVSVAYFTSEAEARENERKYSDDPRFREYLQQMDGEMTFYDLKEPVFA